MKAPEGTHSAAVALKPQVAAGRDTGAGAAGASCVLARMAAAARWPLSLLLLTLERRVSSLNHGWGLDASCGGLQGRVWVATVGFRWCPA